jgi:hypothetical protein
MLMACPSNPSPVYGNYQPGTLFSPAFSKNVTPANPTTASPSYPTPTQGECLQDCPCIAALASIAWVNRNFILNNISGPSSGNGSYTVYFWDYPQASYPPVVALPGPNSGIQLNSVAVVGNPVQTRVVVNQNIALDSSNSPVDTSSRMYYGAGSSNSNEIWPSLYEKAYAKFCLYKCGTPIQANSNLPLNTTTLADPTKDPSFGEVQSLTKTQWGGNAGIALIYLTGLPCFVYNINSSSFTPIPNSGVSASATNPYNYIKTGFCKETSTVYGVNKTKYSLVAWTYPSESQSPAGLYNATTGTGIKYDPSSIMADHCYPILGVFEATINGVIVQYIVLRTTFGGPDPSPNIPVQNYINLAQTPNPTNSSYYDALFKIGTVSAAKSYPPVGQRPNQISIDLSLSDGIFGIEGTIAFKNYFAWIGWARGY